MGRYMRKNKVAMEVAQSALGVRTRARTLAMAQQQARKLQEQQPQQVNVLNLCYLELRSRKLEKLTTCDGDGGGGGGGGAGGAPAAKRCRRPPKTQQRRVSTPHSIGLVSLGPAPISRSNSFSSIQPPPAPSPLASSAAPPLPDEDAGAVHSAPRPAEIEASCGENAFDHDAHSSRDSFGAEHHRRFRESTPSCTEHQLIAEAPGSTSGARLRLTSNPHISSPSLLAPAPTPDEIESFFASSEEPLEEKTRLSDRYNYDFVNDVPLPGRFEWTT